MTHIRANGLDGDVVPSEQDKSGGREKWSDGKKEKRETVSMYKYVCITGVQEGVGCHRLSFRWITAVLCPILSDLLMGDVICCPCFSKSVHVCVDLHTHICFPVASSIVFGEMFLTAHYISARREVLWAKGKLALASTYPSFCDSQHSGLILCYGCGPTAHAQF